MELQNEKDFIKSFSKNLRYLREDAGYTQKQLADKLCIAESTYANWEQGRREPKLYYLAKLINIFKIDIFSLFDTTF